MHDRIAVLVSALLGVNILKDPILKCMGSGKVSESLPEIQNRTTVSLSSGIKHQSPKFLYTQQQTMESE